MPHRLPDHRVRLAAFEWLRAQVLTYGETLPRTLLQHGFQLDGERIPLVGPQGIFKPKVLDRIPLSITTSPDSPYNDTYAPNGLLSYRYRGTDPLHHENVGLREAMRLQLPLVYFRGIIPGKYLAVWPVYIVNDNPNLLTFEVAVDDAALIVKKLQQQSTNQIAESDESRRVYITSTVRARLHQSSFREKVLRAYREQCALCRLRHAELLDAAHIIPDTDPEGEPIIPNGLALCKLHHAAFDRQFLGIRPDYIIELRQDVLDERGRPHAAAWTSRDAWKTAVTSQIADKLARSSAPGTEVCAVPHTEVISESAQMKLFVGITDLDWFNYLSNQDDVDEVNFWQPSASTQFQALIPGEPFLFKLHSPLNYIVGGGFFRHFSILPCSLAWEAFETKNGASSLYEMRQRIIKYRRTIQDPHEDFRIGCILLGQPFFLDKQDWIPIPSDWKPNIVRGKGYDMLDPDEIMLQLALPQCQLCAGDLMPDVVFFGGTVPTARVNTCLDALERADALLAIGSSLMVYSGYRFCRRASQLGKAIAIINPGVTRADDLAHLRLSLTGSTAAHKNDLPSHSGVSALPHTLAVIPAEQAQRLDGDQDLVLGPRQQPVAQL